VAASVFEPRAVTSTNRRLRDEVCATCAHVPDTETAAMLESLGAARVNPAKPQVGHCRAQTGLVNLNLIYHRNGRSQAGRIFFWRAR
jgi:hypothetical protein